MQLHKIKEPTLIIDKNIAIANIKKMADKAIANNLIFRPHFKTHQSAEIGEWFKDFGVNKITVSSVKMAKYFASKGWNDITIAFPLNAREIADIDMLARHVTLNVLISSHNQINKLNSVLNSSLNYLIKIDVGYNRSGIIYEDYRTIDKILSISDKNKLLNFKGFLSHYGNTYNANNKKEVLKIFNSCNEKIISLKQKFIDRYPNLKISIGDTPSCSIADNFNGIDEIRPGNFVFYDLMQINIGVCEEKNIAVKMLCPIIDIYPDRYEILIYGGAIHFSKEFVVEKQGIKSFGRIEVLHNIKGKQIVKDAYIKNLSQEHGLVKVEQSLIENSQIGDLLEIIPIHSCLTANLMRKYTSSENKIIEILE